MYTSRCTHSVEAQLALATFRELRRRVIRHSLTFCEQDDEQHLEALQREAGRPQLTLRL